jgi:tryptophanyl-tRNA synthetase
VRRINTAAGRTILPEAQAVIPQTGRLPGVDGKAKMSKSGGNAIALSASTDQIAAAVKAMFTDPKHLRVDDPGQVEGNVVFTYLDAFDEDRTTLEELKAQYRRGGLGDTRIKRRLEDILQALIGPIRERRAQLAKDPAHVLEVIRSGTKKARCRTESTKQEIIEGLGLMML